MNRSQSETLSTARDVDDHDEIARLRGDVEQLVSFDRRTTGAGESASASHLARRLAQIGADDIALTGFPTQSSWAPAHLTYLAVGAAIAALPLPVARITGVALAIAYELEVSGRIRWVKRALPARRGTSVHAKIPATRASERTLVLVAHHDAAHTGAVWHPCAVFASRRLSALTGRAVPSHLLPLSALVAMALPSARVRAIAAGAAAAGAALMVQSMRSPTAPGANDNASGVAAVLAVAEKLVRNPLSDTDVLIVFPGAEEATNAGIRDWLHRSGRRLDPSTTFFVNLDAVGSNGPVAVARREALTNAADPGAVRRALAAAAELGIPLKVIGIPNPTDAAVLTIAGLPTVSLLSVEDGWISNLHRESDTVDNVNWTTVRHAVALTAHLAASWDSESRLRSRERPPSDVSC